ncbi:MAG: DMT family transporter [Sphingobacteriaceae bacterium]|nr:DMT family transporter [Sphingobacteriaceae bacterium]
MKQSSLSWVYLILLSLIWGSSFILMKEGLVAFSSDEVAALRIAIAFLFLLPFLFKHLKSVNLKKDWKGLVIMGVFGNLLPAFLFTKAETEISSSLTGMLNALTPLFTIVLGILIFKNKVQRYQIIGVAIGLIGALFLLGFADSNEESKNINYSLLVVAATFCYAISVNGIKKYLSHVNSVAASVWSFTIIGPIAIIYLFVNTDFQLHLTQHPNGYSALGFITLLAVFGTSIAIIVFNTLIKQAGTVFASTCTYLIPIVAIGWGLLDGEVVTPVQFLSVGVIILGVWLINKK